MKSTSLMRNGLGVLSVFYFFGCNPGSYPNPGMPSGSGGTGGGMPSGAQNFFNQNVAPILMQNCAACHMNNGAAAAPHFLGTSQAVMYSTLKMQTPLTGNPNTSLLLTKGTHEGPAFTSQQASAVHL